MNSLEGPRLLLHSTVVTVLVLVEVEIEVVDRCRVLGSVGWRIESSWCGLVVLSYRSFARSECGRVLVLGGKTKSTVLRY